MKKIPVKQKVLCTEPKHDWKSKIKVRDTVAWRLPPPHTETIGGATIAGKKIHSDGILNIQGKGDNLPATTEKSDQLCGAVSQGKSAWIKLTMGLKWASKISQKKEDDDFLKVSPSPSPSPRKSPSEAIVRSQNVVLNPNS